MKAKNVFGIAALIVAAALAMQMLQQRPVDARQVAAQAAAVQYGILEVRGNDRVSWRVGGNEVVRVESVQRTIQRLGGTGNYEFIDLVNQIGRNGWTLVQVNDDQWIFRR